MIKYVWVSQSMIDPSISKRAEMFPYGDDTPENIRYLRRLQERYRDGEAIDIPPERRKFYGSTRSNGHKP